MSTLVIGLTGGIGSGKTAVSDRLAALGAAVVDADAIAHQLTAPGGAAIPAIEAAFGASVITVEGAMDRAAMRNLVFADANARVRLEAILHPLIRAQSEARAADVLAKGAPYIVMVIPLLVESATQQQAQKQRVGRVLVVDCSTQIQIDRVMARSGLSADEVRAIMATQANREQRLAVADDVIKNDGDLATLHKQVDGLHVKYLALADKMRVEG